MSAAGESESGSLCKPWCGTIEGVADEAIHPWVHSEDEPNFGAPGYQACFCSRGCANSGRPLNPGNAAPKATP